MERKKELLKQLADCVVDMDDDGIASVAERYIAEGYPVEEGITGGLLAGMNRAGELFDAEEYYIAEILICSDAMYKGLEVLKRALPVSADRQKDRKTVVMGVVEGDTHDIGKNLVHIMMETAGFRIVDLGKDVPLTDFVDVCRREKADLLCMSALMTTTMAGMGRVIQMLKAAGLRDRLCVMVGGGPVTERFAEEIGADAYTKDAVEAVRVAKCLLKEEKNENCAML